MHLQRKHQIYKFYSNPSLSSHPYTLNKLQWSLIRHCAKATEIAWMYPERFGSIVLMMGNFHTICNLISTVGTMFGEAGLRDLAVEPGVIAEGSITKVLEGKQYNRAVRLHTLTCEALMRLAWVGFQDWLKHNHAEYLRC